MNASDLKKALQNLASTAKAKASAWFFKTGKGLADFSDDHFKIIN